MPETYKLAARLEKEWNLKVVRAMTPESVFDIYRRLGTVTPDKKHLVKNLMATYAKAPYHDVSIKGIRATESKGRRAGLLTRGLDYESKSGVRLVNPVGFFESEDIWAYIVTHDIPYLPYYDDLAAIMGIDYCSEQSRTSNWAGTYMHEEGRVQRIKMTRRSLYNKFVELFPEASLLT